MAEPRKHMLIGEMLTQAGILSSATLDRRLEAAQLIGQPLGLTLLQFGDLTELHLISVVQLQSLYLDGALSLEQALAAVKMVHKDNYCTEEALERLGFIEMAAWTSRLGELLVGAELLNEAAVYEALYHALKECRPLGHILVRRGMLKPVVIAAALSVQKRIRAGELSREDGLQQLRQSAESDSLLLD